MAKWKLKATKDEIEQAGEQGEFVQAPVGYYVLEIMSMNYGPNKAGDGNRAEVILKPVKTFKDGVVTPVAENYGQVWDYISDGESSGFKRAQFGLALGFTVKRGQIQEDVEMEAGKPGTVVGRFVLARLRKDTDQDGNYRPKMGAYLPKETLDNAEEGDGAEVEYEVEGEEPEATDDTDAPDFAALGEEADGEQDAGEEGEACETLREWAEQAELDPDVYETWVLLATDIEEWYNSDADDAEPEAEGEAEDGDFYTEESLGAMDKEGLTEAGAAFDLDINEYIKKHKGNAKKKLIEDILAAQGVDDSEVDPF